MDALFFACFVLCRYSLQVTVNGLESASDIYRRCRLSSFWHGILWSLCFRVSVRVSIGFCKIPAWKRADTRLINRRKASNITNKNNINDSTI